MMNQESGRDFAASEAKNMEIKNGFGIDLEKLRTYSYSNEELLTKRGNLSELEKETR